MKLLLRRCLFSLHPALAAISFCAGFSALGVENPDSLENSIDIAVQKVKPALVRILVVSTDYSGGREVKSESSGSGVIISPDGYVVTNHHVAGHAVRLFCTLADRREVEADLVGTDALSDIAVIRLKGEGASFPLAEFGDSSALKVGDSVLAMGSPLALSQSVTLGVVSNTEMVMPEFFEDFGRFTLDGEDVGSMVLWIGHDAAIYGGNSGGPLVNLDGRIVGINEIDLGLSGAIPGNLAKDVAGQIIEKGRVARSWIGVEIQPQLKFTENQTGVLITGVIKDTPAEKSGIQAGDRLIRLAGKETNIRFKEELPRFNRFVAELSPGVEVDGVVLRDGKEAFFKVVPVERGEAKPKEYEIKEWGTTISNVSFMTAREKKRDGQDGVLITSVRPGGPCGEAKPEIRNSDILVAVGGKPIKRAEDFKNETARLVGGKTEPVSVVAEFEREGSHLLTVVKIGIRDTKDAGLEVKKPWLPLATQVLTSDLASQLGVPGKKGVRVTKVYRHPSVSESGIKEGDLILALDGKEIQASEPEHGEVFPAMIRQYKIGAQSDLTIQRGTQELKIPVNLPQAPKLPREMKKYADRRFEFSVRDIAFIDKAEEDWDPEQTGVIVTEVIPGGWAAVGNLHVGDLLLQVNGEPVAAVEELEKQLDGIAAQKPKSVALLVRRGIHQRYLELEPDWDRAGK